MVRKSSTPAKRRPLAKGARSKAVYPALAQTPSPAERLSERLLHAEAPGVRPMDDAALNALGEVWPPDEDVDEFLDWLRRPRIHSFYAWVMQDMASLRSQTL